MPLGHGLLNHSTLDVRRWALSVQSLPLPFLTSSFLIETYSLPTLALRYLAALPSMSLIPFAPFLLLFGDCPDQDKHGYRCAPRRITGSGFRRVWTTFQRQTRTGEQCGLVVCSFL